MLRGIGIDAVSVNGKRIIWRSGITDSSLGNATVIRAIGNKDILKDALTRQGGILEQIAQKATVSTNDHLSIQKL
ncbi:DUF881 domain-containing protein [Candidatus Berkelbacteria bacterium]|nr:DUF881 domain-containing protein [Candidatus Berkelbacteria bacterium]